jgi:hypothetical protein
MKTQLILAAYIFMALLTACSSHTPPTGDDIKQAIEEGRSIKVNDVQIENCERHNDVDQGDDPHFDWYGCHFTATFTSPTGASTTNTKNGAFVFSDGWHDTR